MTSKFTRLVFIILVIWLSFFSELLSRNYNLSIFIFLNFISILYLIKAKNISLRRVLLRENFYFWLYLFFVSLSTWQWHCKSVVPLDSTINILLLVAFPLFFLSRYTLSQEDTKNIFLWLVISGIIVSFIGLYEFLAGKSLIYPHLVNNNFYLRFISTHRMMSTFIHSNILGAYFITLLPWAVYFAYEGKAVLVKKIGGLAFILFVLSIILTFSRGTWLAFFLIAVLFLNHIKQGKLIFVILAVFIIFSLAMNLLKEGSEMKRRFSPQKLFNYVMHSHRSIKYPVTLSMLKKHPLVGVGWGHFREQFNNYSKVRLDNEIMIPDSVYLMHLSEAGILGFCAFMVFIFSLFRKRRWQVTPLTLSFIGLLFNMGFFDGFLWISTLSLFWLLAGFMASENKQEHFFNFKNNEVN